MNHSAFKVDECARIRTREHPTQSDCRTRSSMSDPAVGLSEKLFSAEHFSHPSVTGTWTGACTGTVYHSVVMETQISAPNFRETMWGLRNLFFAFLVGLATAKVITVGSPSESLRNAAALAETGDSIEIGEGVFSGPESCNVVFKGSIHITGAGSSRTVIDCGGQTRCMVLSGLRGNVRGLTLRAGMAPGTPPSDIAVPSSRDVRQTTGPIRMLRPLPARIKRQKEKFIVATVVLGMDGKLTVEASSLTRNSAVRPETIVTSVGRISAKLAGEDLSPRKNLPESQGGSDETRNSWKPISPHASEKAKNLRARFTQADSLGVRFFTSISFFSENGDRHAFLSRTSRGRRFLI